MYATQQNVWAHSKMYGVTSPFKTRYLGRQSSVFAHFCPKLHDFTPAIQRHKPGVRPLGHR